MVVRMHKKTHGQQPLCLCPPTPTTTFPLLSLPKNRKKTHTMIWTKNSSVVPPVFSLHGNSTFIVVLNLISKWACWLQKPDNEECNLSGHKHRRAHQWAQVLATRSPVVASFTRFWLYICNCSFFCSAFFGWGWGGWRGRRSVGDLNFLLSFVRSHSSNIKHSQGRARVHLSARTLSISVRRHNFDE